VLDKLHPFESIVEAGYQWKGEEKGKKSGSQRYSPKHIMIGGWEKKN